MDSRTQGFKKHLFVKRTYKYNLNKEIIILIGDHY